jgi:hypothetical protein
MFQQGETLDLSREDMGIITVSQSISTLGIIESANAVALSMFGYNKRDMVNQVCCCVCALGGWGMDRGQKQSLCLPLSQLPARLWQSVPITSNLQCIPSAPHLDDQCGPPTFASNFEQNINLIVPQPMCGMHDTYLRNFVESGHSVRQVCAAKSLRGSKDSPTLSATSVHAR